MDKNEERLRMLREKRARIVEARNSQEKINEYGPIIISEINFILGTTLSIEDFNSSIKPSLEFRPSKSFDAIEGLVVAHTSRNKALDILNCCNQVIGGLNGLIGIDGCKNMGLANVTKINIVKLIEIAKNLNDSVLFYPKNIQGILLVDYYEIHGTQGSNDYSIVVQGCELEEKLSECFPDKSKVYLGSEMATSMK